MHTVKRVCTLVLTGLLALPMAAPAGAAAASFSDLPSSHWAYIAMTEAAGYGILQGTGANTMSPSAPLTWPQFLAMAARAFAPEEYARSAASGAAWDQAGLDAARSAGLLEGLDEAALTGAVTRQDAAVVLCNALPEEYTPSFWDQPIDPTALSDWGADGQPPPGGGGRAGPPLRHPGQGGRLLRLCRSPSALRRRGAVDAGTGAGGQ